MRQKLTKVNTAAPTADGKRRFLAALEGLTEGKRVRQAAQAAGVHRATPYRWRAQDSAFASAWAAIDDRQYAAFLVRYEAAQAARLAARARRYAELRPIFAANAAKARAAKRR
ncbi:MAG: hypothetical protein WCI67_18780 [Chloroflexales bacterium]